MFSLFFPGYKSLDCVSLYDVESSKATKALMIHSAETWVKNFFSPVQQVQFLDFTNALFSQWLRRLIRDEIYWLIMRAPARDLLLHLCFWLWQSIGQVALLLLFPRGFFCSRQLSFFSRALFRHCVVESHWFWLGIILLKFLHANTTDSKCYFTSLLLPHRHIALKQERPWYTISLHITEELRWNNGWWHQCWYTFELQREIWKKNVRLQAMPDVFFHGIIIMA